MQFETKPTFHSVLFPGVSVKLRKLSHGMRTRIDLALAATRAKIRELNDERAEILEPAQEQAEASAAVAKDDPERGAALTAAIEKLLSREQMRILRDRLAEINSLVYREIQPGYLNEAVKGIAGLDIDVEGDGAYTPCTTVADLIEYGPPELVAEIYEVIQEGVGGLSAEERKNSPSPSISNAPAVAPTNATTAAPAATPATS
jgi:hypothetical protein